MLAWTEEALAAYIEGGVDESRLESWRWHLDRLWFLESGEGSLAVLDQSGRPQAVARLPGFTRGMDFYGPIAFIGLSQVRESAVFSGIPLTERLEERVCGVWAVNLASGEKSGTLTSDQLENLALRGRDIFDAISPLPGVIDTSDGRDAPSSTTL